VAASSCNQEPAILLDQLGTSRTFKPRLPLAYR
jgi:hypothetical protein